AKERGIATVFQDLATVPLMSIWRNFFLGSEPTRGRGPLRRVDVKSAQDTMVGELKKMGIDVRDPDQPVGTLSGGERQAVAIARAVYFGAKVLILDEPTSALGVKQSGVVLRYVAQARDRGLGVIFITHNPHHAYPVGDRFVICGATGPARIDEAVRSFGFARGTADWRQVVQDPAVDVVVIAAPNMLHVELVEAAAAAGKHVFCEKPVGGTPEQTVRAEEAARDAGVITGVGYNYRWAPLVRYAAQLIGDGRLG